VEVTGGVAVVVGVVVVVEDPQMTSNSWLFLSKKNEK